MERQEVSPEQAGRIIGKDRDSVVALIRAGEIRATDKRNAGAKLPRYKIRVEELLRWEQSRAVAPDGEKPNPRPVRRAVTGQLSRLLAAQRVKRAGVGAGK